MKRNAFTLRIRVRYAETDTSGFVYHANYLNYFEWARTEFLRDRGLAYSELEKSGIFLVVADLQARYLAPAFYDDELAVAAWIESVHGAVVRFGYEVRRIGENNPVLALGETKLAAVDGKSRRPIRLPASVTSRLTSEESS